MTTFLETLIAEIQTDRSGSYKEFANLVSVLNNAASPAPALVDPPNGETWKEHITNAVDALALVDLDRAVALMKDFYSWYSQSFSDPGCNNLAPHLIEGAYSFYTDLGKKVTLPSTMAQYKVLIKEATKPKGGDYLHNIRESLFAAEKKNAEGTGTLKLSSPLFLTGQYALSFYAHQTGTDPVRYEMIKGNLEEAFLDVAGLYCKKMGKRKSGLTKRDYVFSAITLVFGSPSMPANATTAARLLKKHFGYSTSQPFRSLSFKGKVERLCHFEV